MIRRAIALVALLFIEAGADAQPQQPITATVAPPAERLAITGGGVDIRTGRFAYTATDLSIGEDNETGGLALIRTLLTDVGMANPFSNFSHNWHIMAVERRVDIARLDFTSGAGPDYRIMIRFGGRSETFDALAGSGYGQTSNDSLATLTFTGSKPSAGVVYTFQSADGTIATFRPLGGNDCGIRCAFVSEVVQPDGTRFSFDYEQQGASGPARLRSVTSTRGYALLLQYGAGADWAHISSACLLNLTLTTRPSDNICPATPLATSSYSYTTFGSGRRLASATDAGNATTSYGYAAASGATEMSFTRPGQTAPWLTNTFSYHTSANLETREVVGLQVFGDGRVYHYDYDDLASQTGGSISELAGGAYTANLGTGATVRYGFPRRPISMNPPVFDPNGQPQENVGDAYFQLTPGPVEIIDSLGHTTTFNYCDPYLQANLPATDTVFRCVVTRLQSSTDPAGIRTEFSYDGFRNITHVRRSAAPGSGLPDIVTSATYLCVTAVVCAKPRSRTDANGHTTDYIYDSTHGGILSETGPAPSSGAPRPQTRHEYAQRYAWLADGAGGFAQASHPIWVRTATSTCQNSAATGNPVAPCGTAGDEVRTTFDYGPDSGPNNLLLRGIHVTGTGVNARTCYGYDARGRRISETGPGAGLASCP